MVDPIAWLGEWEPIESVGKHDIIYPAGFAHGYKWRGVPPMDRRPRVVNHDDPLRNRVQRAIPVDGTVSAVQPSWINSPQVRFWMQEPKKKLRTRILAWLRRPAR